VNTEKIHVMEECARGSLAGELTFPEVVGRLVEVGVERYHADYSRQEITYYLADGDSHVVSAPHEEQVTATAFDAAAVEAAVRQSQRDEHTYVEFVRKTMAAGCVGYFVQITGKRVLYFGGDGDIYVEHFPPVSVVQKK
jgi:uncharacterized protein YbcV (DUF1398 family)